MPTTRQNTTAYFLPMTELTPARKHAPISQDYLDTLLRYYEEEISGEAYFYKLVEAFGESEKVTLLARMERSAAQTIEPLLEKYNLGPINEAQLKDIGEREVSSHQGFSWKQFMTYIVERYPLYLDEFYALEAMAPAEDLPFLQALTEHEIAVIEFAEHELAGKPDSVQPLKLYLALPGTKGASVI
jgi:dimethylamine/trimethylamine dehydrogenase